MVGGLIGNLIAMQVRPIGRCAMLLTKEIVNSHANIKILEETWNSRLKNENLK